VKIALLIRSLERGGAERQLVNLANSLKISGHQVKVVVFYSGGSLETLLHEVGVPVVDLKKSGRWDMVGFFLRAQRWLYKERPQVLYSFLVGANLFASLLKPFVPGMRTVWGVRASNMALAKYDKMSRLVFGLSRVFACGADLIIANSEKGREYHVARGYPPQRTITIPNGIDTRRFRRDEAARTRQRAEWGVSGDEQLVGLVARLDPMKDHENFLAAAARVTKQDETVRFVCIGDGPEERFAVLVAYAEQLGIGTRMRWESGKTDMAGIYSALDIAVSASAFGEGFSNALAEAMACGVPCVATEVGDANAVVGETGLVVPPSDSVALADGILRMIHRLPGEREMLGGRAREHISTSFRMDRLVSETVAELQRIAQAYGAVLE